MPKKSVHSSIHNLLPRRTHSPHIYSYWATVRALQISPSDIKCPRNGWRTEKKHLHPISSLNCRTGGQYTESATQGCYRLGNFLYYSAARRCWLCRKTARAKHIHNGHATEHSAMQRVAIFVLGSETVNCIWYLIQEGRYVRVHPCIMHIWRRAWFSDSSFVYGFALAQRSLLKTLLADPSPCLNPAAVQWE